MFAVAISPDGNWVYVVTRPVLPFAAKLPTTLTAYSASRQGAPVTIATWTGREPDLLPIGGMLFAWMYDMPSSASAPSPASTAYLINPATRTKTAVRLPGLPERAVLVARLVTGPGSGVQQMRVEDLFDGPAARRQALLVGMAEDRPPAASRHRLGRHRRCPAIG